MKNLKKVLALVLVIASLMGMATMASATKSDDYSDADSITHVEAVDVMSPIGVFDGISGAFSGDSILTREQAAKIITYMILGKDNADALVAAVAPYTDVSRDRWSAGSIAYCKNAGILAGVGNGRFEPDGKLTGVAFAKMCLVALGYDPDVEILTGPQWAVNTSSVAIADAGITANLSQISLADEMTREDACQMAFNTLKADLVRYDDRGTNITVNNGSGADISISSKPSKAEPITKDIAQVDDRHNIKNINNDETLQFGERYFSKLTKNKGSGVDSFGRPATTWQYKSEEIGTYVDSAQLVKSWTAKASKGEMQSAIGGSIVDKLSMAGENDGTYKFTVYVDGAKQSIDGDNIDKYFFTKNSTAAAGKAVDTAEKWNIGKSGNGVLTELYMDDDDNVTVVMINTYLVQATADYNTVNARVNVEAKPIDASTAESRTPVSTSFLPTHISKDDFDVTGVKDGDYLLLTVSFDGAWGSSRSSCTVESVTPATIQTGNVTEYTEKDDVTVGGTKYTYNRILGDDEKSEEFAINSDATLVLDTYGYIMFVDEAVTSSNFVYIDNFGSTSTMTSNPVADAYFADGTNSEISVTRVDDMKSKNTITTYNSKESSGSVKGLNKLTSSDHLRAHWYTFSGTTGGDYTLDTPSDKRYDQPRFALTSSNPSANFKLIKSGAVRFMSEAKPNLDAYTVGWDTTNHKPSNSATSYTDVDKVRADEKTIFVIKDEDGDVTSYTGIANVPDVNLTTTHEGRAKISWINKKGNEYASYVFVDVSGTKGATVDGGTSTADYMFTLKSSGNRTHVDGLTYYKYRVVIDGKEEERWVSSNLLGTSDADKGVLFYDVKEDKDGRIKDGKKVGTKSNLRQFSKDVTNAEITQSGNSLYIEALATADYALGSDTTLHADKSNLIANSKSNINLVIGSKADDLLYDGGADYETHMGVSASFVSSFLSGYEISGKIFLVVDDDNSDVIDTMWIYVDTVREKP